MEKKTISVIIPVYKVEKYLDKCVESVVNQTYKDIEIILVDDGSPDNCPKMCDEWAKKDKRIKVIHKKNGGLSDARNFGIEKAIGDFLMFVDSDDYLALDTCEKLYNNLVTNNADVSMCEAKLVYEEKENDDEKQEDVNVRCFKSNEIQNSVIYFNINIPYVVTAWGKLYKKELFKTLRYPVGRLHEDGFVYYKILFDSKKIVCTNEKLYFYLQRPTSIMSTRNEKNIKDSLAAINEEFEFLNKNLPTNEIKNQDVCLHLLRNCYYFNRKMNRQIKKEIYENFMKIYNFRKAHTKKDKLFKFSPKIYCLLLSIKKCIR